jgi:hypothetical protein
VSNILYDNIYVPSLVDKTLHFDDLFHLTTCSIDISTFLKKSLFSNVEFKNLFHWFQTMVWSLTCIMFLSMLGIYITICFKSHIKCSKTHCFHVFKGFCLLLLGVYFVHIFSLSLHTNICNSLYFTHVHFLWAFFVDLYLCLDFFLNNVMQ